MTVQTWRSCTAGDPGDAKHPPLHLTHGHVTRHAFQQDVGALPYQPPGTDEDQQGDSDRDDGVHRRPTGSRDDRGSPERPDGPQSVSQDVEVRGPGVEIPVPAAVQDAETDEVDQKTTGSNDQKQPGTDRLGVLNPLDGLDDDPPGDPEEGGAVDQGRQNLPTLIAEGLAVVGRAKRDPGAEQREAERARVGEHVPGVREQRQRAAEPSSNGLDHHEAQGEDENEGQAGKRVRG